MEKWMVSAKKADFQKLAAEFGIDPVTARLIRNRDIVGEEARPDSVPSAVVSTTP